jgi:4-carboxymuconolactone decarboxylase
MTEHGADGATLRSLDDATRRLVRIAAAAAGCDEAAVRDALRDAVDHVPVPWVEEVLLQTYLFAGFPRALNAMRLWRRHTPEAPAEGAAPATDDVRRAGETTCARVYGAMYERLRDNVRALHPALDEWMILEGYGKVLSRPALDLPRRELCIVAACAATGQERQLHSHLHGARNAGVPADVLGTALDTLRGLIDPARVDDAYRLLGRVEQGR